MRLSIQLLPLLLLVILPIYGSLQGWGLFKVLLVLVAILILRTALVLKSVFSKMEMQTREAGNDRYILETNMPSHFVEKVRWVLDYIGQPYEEEQDIGVIGRFILGRSVPTLKIPSKEISVSNSSNILRYLYGVNAHKSDKLRKFLEPTKETLALEVKLDLLAEETRKFGYRSAMTHPNHQELMQRIWGANQSIIPQWQKWMLNAMLPVLMFYVYKKVDTREETVQQARINMRELMDELDAILSDGRKYLQGGDEPTYIDFVMATMIGLISFHKNRGGKAVEPASVFLEADLGDEVKKERAAALKRPCGKLATKLYEEFRFAKLDH